jgi:hypothetical protein
MSEMEQGVGKAVDDGGEAVAEKTVQGETIGEIYFQATEEDLKAVAAGEARLLVDYGEDNDLLEVPEGYSLVQGWRHEADRKTLEEIRGMLPEWEKKARRWNADSYPLHERVKHLLMTFDDEAKKQLGHSRQFRDRVVTEMRAMALVTQMCLSAATHREKDARIGGLGDVIEQGIRRLMDISFSTFTWWRWPDEAFSSDKSVVWQQRRIWELEKEIQALKAQVVENGLAPATDAVQAIEPQADKDFSF